MRGSADHKASGPGVFDRENNFDLIRLVAAGQVALLHAIETFQLRLPFHDISMALIGSFPGVPIFFVVSGFLISASYFRARSLREFALNRALRIFPALWLCLLLSIALVAASGYLAQHMPGAATFAAWIAAQATIVQFYNPEFLRGFGVGALNGSLWTIPVEMQFYVATPVFAILLMRRRRLFWLALVAFAIFHLVNSSGMVGHRFGDGARKLVAVTMLPWFVLFLAGMVASYFWPRVSWLFRGRFALWAVAWAAIVAVGVVLPIGNHGNAMLLPWALLLSGTVLAAGFSNSTLASRLLGRNDVSYGLYIYHMPIFNFLLYLYGDRSVALAVVGLVATVVAATLSWRFVERPALGLKHHTLLSRTSGQRSTLPAHVSEADPS